MKHDGHKHDGHKHHGRKHGRRFHGPGFAFAAPYYDDYAYYDTCWRPRLIRGVWRRVWVCHYPPY